MNACVDPQPPTEPVLAATSKQRPSGVVYVYAVQLTPPTVSRPRTIVSAALCAFMSCGLGEPPPDPPRGLPGDPASANVAPVAPPASMTRRKAAARRRLRARRFASAMSGSSENGRRGTWASTLTRARRRGEEGRFVARLETVGKDAEAGVERARSDVGRHP